MALNKATVAAAVAALVVVVAALMAAPSEAVLTCGQVGSDISQCIPYVTGKAPISKGCCDGVKRLNNQASTTADRQSACKCLKSLAGSIKSLNLATVAGVPGKCGVSVPFPISMSTDCNKVH